MVLLRSRIALIAVALAVAAASLAVIAITSLPASSHGNVVVLQCSAAGVSADSADTRAIQFTVSQSFVSVEVRMDASAAGVYQMTAELRRSSGFTSFIQSATRAGINLPGTIGTHPYPAVHFDFPLSGVVGATTFTLRFVDIVGPGTLYIEQTGIGNFPCPNMMETEGNTQAVPVERSDPAGLKVIAVRGVAWGDVDCSDGPPSAVDALKILRHVAVLPVTQTAPCPNLGNIVLP